jgi:endoglucanase
LLLVIAATLAYRRQHVVLGGDGAVVGLTVLVPKRVAAEEVIQISGFGAALLPGAKGFHNGDVYRLNASCLPLQLFIQLGQELPEGPWQQVATQIPDILRGSSPNGFASDWAEFKPGKGLTPASLGSYDAIRVYLWAGMLDPATRDVDAVLKALPGMAGYLHANAIPPSQVKPDGTVVNAKSPVGFSAALLPYLSVLLEAAILALRLFYPGK